MIHTNRFIAFFCVAASVLATSCVNEFEEGQAPVSGEGYYISLTGDINEGGVESRTVVRNILLLLSLQIQMIRNRHS